MKKQLAKAPFGPPGEGTEARISCLPSGRGIAFVDQKAADPRGTLSIALAFAGHASVPAALKFH